MSDVHLITEMFSSVDRLSEILQDRQIPFICSDNITADVDISSSKCQTLIISDQYYKKVGNDALISFAKTLRASQICAVSENQSEFGITSELGGKMIFLRLPIRESENISEDYGLQMLATLVSDSGVVAASDESSQKLFNLAKRVANTDVTVFINGPTGTGKEVLSKFIHNNSKRNEAGFIAVNCAAIPENMLEAILFGYEKGSFTGASTTNKGIFRAADSGTLLLDEISEMPISLQAKLLRALQEKSVTPIGSQTSIPVDVRVIATTNRNMVEEIRNGNFREDLYYRLNVFPLSTLSLAERTSDIIAISTVLIKRHCNEIESIPFLAKSALNLLVNYTWPGNVRELENVIQRALVLSDGKTISAEDIIIDDTLYQGGGQAHIQNMLEKQAIAG
ncbi:MAG: ATPase AAA [Candidatus Dadabacteria bacterium]|nr:MAG: ATPase AAA [Candidatus Dadabacteria bacterium]